MGTITAVLVSAVAFVGSHFLLSHPFRKSLVDSLGEKAFLGLYSLVAFVTLTWVILAYRAAPPTQFLWPVGDLLWAIVSVLMLIASILFMGSVIGNPALVTAKQSEAAPEARGAFAITRHPMMWSFACQDRLGIASPPNDPECPLPIHSGHSGRCADELLLRPNLYKVQVFAEDSCSGSVTEKREFSHV